MPIPKFITSWEPVEGFPNAFRWGKASYWKGTKGWWGNRGDDTMGGPFRGPKLARTWAEEPFREAFNKKQEVKAQKAEAQREKDEAKAKATWGNLAPENREIRPGQVWGMKQVSCRDHFVLVLEVRKTTLVVLTRTGKGRWNPKHRDVRDAASLPRLFHYIGTAALPRSPGAS